MLTLAILTLSARSSYPPSLPLCTLSHTHNACTHIQVCTQHSHAHRHTRMLTHMHAHSHSANTHVHTQCSQHTYTHAHPHTCMHTRSHTCSHRYIQACTHTMLTQYTYAHSHALWHTCTLTQYTCIHSRTQCPHTCMYMHARTRTHMHMQGSCICRGHAHAHTMHAYMYAHVCSHGHTQRSHNKNMHAHMPAHTSPRILLCAVTMLQERPWGEGADLGGFPRSPGKGLRHHPGPLSPDLQAWGSPWLKPRHPRQTAELSWLTAPAPPRPCPPPAWVLLLPGLRQ